MAAEIGISVAAKVAEYLVAPIGRPFGYLFLFSNNLKNLQEQIAQLEYMRVVVQRQVDAAKRNVEVIRPAVEAWLTEVDKTKSDSDEIFEQVREIGTNCFRGWCLHTRSRYSISRRAKKLGEVALHLQGSGKFDRVADPIPITCLPTISSGDFKTFESRNFIMKEIMEALQDDEICMIGICGMGGTGKTMLVKEISQKAKDDHMFDEVALAVVSQNPNVREIQDQLADRLGLSFPEKTISVRAERLHARLMMNNSKKILIILDDVWNAIELGEIGIPVGGDKNGCKVLFTSRIQLLFHIRETQRKNISVGFLSEEEAWDFFKEIVGNSVENPDLLDTPRKVAGECGGLPLAIKTVGSALRDKDGRAWKDALTQLQENMVIDIQGMHEKLYSSIKLSFSFLESGRARSLLMLCSLFPEDYDIPIEILVRYGKGLCLFSDIDSLEKIRNRVHSLVSDLRSFSLLLAGNEEGFVKMHDVVRDVMILIASCRDHRLKQLQFVNEGKSGAAISLNINEFDKLPADLYFPQNLQLFQLRSISSFSRDRLNMRDNSFEGMKELRVIHVTGTSLNLLPSSLCFLSSLCTLCLEYCTLRTNLSIIGSCKQLEVLSFFLSDLDELPGEIRELRKLKVLDLRCSKGPRTIPSGVFFSELTNLEELYIGNFRDWEEAEYHGNARIRELNSLSSLKILQMHASSCDVISELTDFAFEKLVKFNISVGSLGHYFQSYDFDNSLEFVKGRGSSDMNVLSKTKIISLLKRAVSVKLECEGWIRNPLYELCQENTLNMRNLTLDNYSEDCLINLSNENGYGNANASSSSSVKSCLWRGPIQPTGLQNLNVLRLYKCNSVKVVFPHCVVVCMAQLRKLFIWECSKMEHIVGNKEEDNDDDNRVEFPKLEYLQLQGMPAFRSFYSAFDPEDTARNTMFNHQVIFPCLEIVKVHNMKNLSQVVDGQMLSCCLCKVREMRMSHCENLLVVAASDMVSLKTLKVYDCQSLEAVFSFEGNQATLGQLDKLKLKNLPKLVEIWKIPPPGNGTFQNLTDLRVEKCKNLRFLLPFHVAKMLVNIQYIRIKQCETMEAIIETDRVEIDDDDAELALFPDLETLELQDLPMLEMFSSGSLRTLYIAGCPKWKIFHKAPISDAKSIQTSNLKTSEGSFFHQKVKFPSLKKLFISRKEVEMLHDEEHQYAAPDKLRELYINNCDVLLYAICINDCWRNLEKLQIYNCKSLIKVFQLQGTRVEDEPESTNADPQSSKHQLLKDSLCNLREVSVSYCKKLLHIFPSTDQFGVSVFRNLTSLGITHCDNVRYLLSPSVARELSSIQKLEIEYCKLIEEIVVRDVEDEEKIDKLVLPGLKELVLRKLENLRCFFYGDLDFPSLVDFKFNECPKMEVLCCGTLCTPKIVKDLNDTIRSQYRRETAGEE
ncbi:hypothetical protein M9H77_28920 [Catharanthus roseus]|uniref:Uncharacterized protein n=1 Tax=Catharanthus roseus TaxID=4058 RepID=A0ACC0AI55_CATRO|nr:hypothetical protein M9H77_28920 [Catharanthus roseus]